MREYAYLNCLDCGKALPRVPTDSEVFPNFCNKRCMFNFETDNGKGREKETGAEIPVSWTEL